MNPRDPQQLDAQVAELSYEDARSKLVDTVARLEQGNIPLEEALELWELGEALARRCETWLAGARERLAQAQEQTRAVLDNASGDN
ncbi:exodeoxyribonuclease VII small subunit [Arcanobacterium phocisimile]|uniref:Exodeoxyribonuclease 7 small subunit n=1 Tax=Arcanobacterium phocisimile TaxID=1302235 RepID=A0ABX7IFN1_9ACTO|nr:exodeoxyribonuclease VII small subunit [Arcanobacterium phocisimile]QRV01946.1 exodeoxyribonuclease VII small subunit [Arcanobacterium phocisimile]